MKKTTTKKLSLNRETVLELGQRTLNLARGGAAAESYSECLTC